MTRVVLYTRVSSEEQAKRGFSLPEQLRDLHAHADEHGLEVVEVCTDEGYSRSSLNRPGITRARELVALGGVDQVLAWKRDRFGAHPWPGILEVEFAASGCALRALDDSGEGEDAEFLSGVKDLIARQELRTMVRRTRAGKAGKVRSGKVLGSGPAPYGFRYVLDERGTRVGLEVDEATMPVVRRLFELVGHRGLPMYAAGRQLEREGDWAPRGGPWRVSVIRNLLRNDAYRPHTHAEVAALVTPEVAATLDPEGVYGIHYFGKRRVTGPARGSRTYRKVPREDWLAVPIPPAGVPREWVESALRAIEDNPPMGPRLGGGGREHELSGGVAVCAVCGRNLTTSTSGGPKRKRRFWYYACPGAMRKNGLGQNECGQDAAYHNADDLEAGVLAEVDGELMTDASRLERNLDAAMDRERAALGLASSSDAAKVAKAFAEELERCDRENDALVRLYTTGRLRGGDAAYDRRAAEIDARRASAAEGLAASRESGSRLEEMLRAKRALLEMFGTGLMVGLYWFPKRLRRQIYGLMGLRVLVHPDGGFEIEGAFDADLMRLSPEVEEYAAGLREIEGRLDEADALGLDATHAERVDRIERELAALRRRMDVRGPEATSA
jgi:site-specific DNA recombinase